MSCAATGEWYSGSMSFSASSDEGGGSDYGSIYLGTTCAEGDTDTSPPSISWVDYTTYGNEERGTSGYVILYGSNFTSPYAATTTSIDHGSATYVSEDQINLYYSIPVNTNSGGNSTGISVTLAGVDPTAYATSYVYDCPLYISSASGTLQAGGTTPSSFSLYGSCFGTNPSVTVSFDGAYYTPTGSGSDSEYDGSVLLAASAYSGTATVSVGASNDGGGSFFSGGGGDSPSGSTGVAVAASPVPSISDVSGGPFSAGNTYYPVTISGSNFGSAGSVSFDSGTFTVSEWSTSITGTWEIDQSDTDVAAQVRVTPYNGLQSAPKSVTLGCGDIVNSMIAEYWANPAITYHPSCPVFVQSSPSTNFSFATLNSSRQAPYTDGSTQYPYAILTGNMGTGLDAIVSYEPYAIAITSGYRNPGRQAVVANGKYPNDQHTHGDAVDMNTYNNTTDWTEMHDAAKAYGTPGGTPCIEPMGNGTTIPGSTNSHLHVDWRATGCAPSWLM